MYFTPIHQKIFDVKRFIYIAPYLGATQDENYNQKVTYGTPKKYFFNVQPVSSTSDSIFKTERLSFGENVDNMKVVTIRQRDKYFNSFNELDRVYLDGATPNDELENGDNANYYIYSVIKQNTIIKLYLQKITK